MTLTERKRRVVMQMKKCGLTVEATESNEAVSKVWFRKNKNTQSSVNLQKAKDAFINIWKMETFKLELCSKDMRVDFDQSTTGSLLFVAFIKNTEQGNKYRAGWDY